MKRIYWRLRIFVKDLVCYSGIGWALIEYCEDCGIRQPLVWWSPNDLWKELTGYSTPTGDNAPGILCPRCFDARASRRGILLRWRPESEQQQEAK